MGKKVLAIITSIGMNLGLLQILFLTANLPTLPVPATPANYSFQDSIFCWLYNPYCPSGLGWEE